MMPVPSVRAAVLAVFSLALVPPAVGTADVAIAHAGVECLVAGRFPRLEAGVPAEVEVARARIHFRPETTKQWYSVEMTRTGAALVGVLPRPTKRLASFRYYIEVTDAAFASSRTAEYAPLVAGTAAECSGKVQAATEAAASIVLTAPGGAPPVPAGFATSGVTTAVAASAAVVGAAAGGAAAAGGGGIGATALIVGGAVVAAGAAVAVATGAGGLAGGDQSVPYDVTFDSPGLDVSSCVGRPISWCCQPVNARRDGSFDETWSTNEPNTLRIVGRVTESTFEAALTCVSGGPSGSLSALGSNGSYRGMFEFRGSRGTVTAARH